MNILRKTDLESMEKELQVLENPKGILGGWGEHSNPYPQNVYEYLCSIDAFEGGYVEGMGYVNAYYGDGGSGEYTYTPTGSVSYMSEQLLQLLASSSDSITGSVSSTSSRGSTVQGSVIDFLNNIPDFQSLYGYNQMISYLINSGADFYYCNDNDIRVEVSSFNYHSFNVVENHPNSGYQIRILHGEGGSPLFTYNLYFLS